TIMKKGIPAYGIPEVLAYYRLVDNSISSNKLKAAKRNWEVYYKIEQQSLLRSMWYFANYSIRSIILVLKFKFVKYGNGWCKELLSNYIDEILKSRDLFVYLVR